MSGGTLLLSRGNLTVKIFCAILVVGTVAFFVPRARLGPIFDETGVIRCIEGVAQNQQLHSPLDFLVKNSRDIWYEPVEGPPKRLLQVFYRPLQVNIVALKVLTFYVLHDLPLVPVFLNALLLSLAGAFVYLLGFKLTNDQFASAGGAFLMMFSTSALTGTWVVLSGEHALVPLLMCASFLSYLRFKESGSWRWLGAVLLILFLSPLYKEYTGIAAFVIFFTELSSSSRNRRFLLAMLPLLFHSIYTSFFINLFFFHHFVLLSVFEKTHVFFHGRLRWESINHFFFILPPLVSLLGLAGIWFDFFKAQKGSGTETPKLYWAMLILAFGWGCLFLTSNHPLVALMPVGLASIVSLSALKCSRMLAIWSLLTWVPYLGKYHLEVYMMYAIGPFAIIFLWYIRRLFEGLWRRRDEGVARFYTAHAVVLLLCVAFIDQALNLNAVYLTFRGSILASVDIAHCIATDALDKPIVLISHTMIAEDVQYYLTKNEGKYLDKKGYTVKRAVGKRDPQNYTDEEKFGQLLDSESDKKALYLLDVELQQPTLLSQFRKRLTHKVRQGYAHTMDVRYPWVDPLKYFIPIEYTSYPGSPDLGFYINMDKGLFYRRIYARHTLWRVEP